MNKIALLKQSLAHVKEIVNGMDFSSSYGAKEQEFFANYKKELEDELAEEEASDDSSA